MAKPPLPVDPARLRQQFPTLTEDDLDAFVEVTRSVLGTDPERRAARVRKTLERGRAVLAGSPAAGDSDRLAARYVVAVEKMQATGSPEPHVS